MDTKTTTEVISEQQIGAIINIMDTIAAIKLEKIPKKSKRRHFGETLQSFLEAYHIDSPKELSIAKYHEAIGFLNSSIEKLLALRVDTKATPNVKEFLARAKRELKLNESKVLNYAFHNLPLDRRVYSLTKLSVEDLARLEKLLFQKR
jgi:hypothetical protein